MVHIVPEAAGTEKTERRYQIPMWGYFIALISGALMSIQGVFNSGVTKQTSVWLAASFVQFSAMLVCLAAWFLNGHPGTVLDLFRIDRKYMLLGGVIGAFITYTVIVALQKLGPAKSGMFIITSQIVVAYLIEVFGLFGVEKTGFDWRKILGLLIIIGGIVLFKWQV